MSTKIIKLASGLVLYSGPALTLTAQEASNGEWHDRSVTTSNAVLEDVSDLPDDWQGGHYTRIGTTWARTADGTAAVAAALSCAINEFVLAIDRDVDAIVDAVVGRRVTEYRDAFDDALAYQAAGYTGTVPPGVKSWQDAKVASVWTAQQAADNIIATGTAWMAAQAAIRAARLLRKEQARIAATPAALATVRAQWAGFVSYMRGQLGI